MQKNRHNKNNGVVILSIINLLIFLVLFFLSNSGSEWEVMPGSVLLMLFFTAVLFILFFVQLKIFLSRKKELVIGISFITGMIPGIVCLIQWISRKTIIDSLRIPKLYYGYVPTVYLIIISFLILDFIILGTKIFKKKEKSN